MNSKYILKSNKKSLRGRFQKFKSYTRRCRRCQKLFKTKSKQGKICDKCRKPIIPKDRRKSFALTDKEKDEINQKLKASYPPE